MKVRAGPRRLWFWLAAIVLGTAVALGRHAVAGFVLARAAATLSAERVSFGRFVLGPHASSFSDVRIGTSAGDDLLAARRIVIRYDVGALLTHERKYGLIALDVESPTFTLVQHTDGSYNLPSTVVAGPASAAPADARAAVAPLWCDVRIRSGTVRLVDKDTNVPDLARQEFHELTLDAAIRSDRRSTGSAAATLVGRRAAGAPVGRWPLTVRGLADVPRGIGVVHVRADRVPLRGLASFFQQSTSVRVDDGLVERLDVRLFALDLGSPKAPGLHAGGSGELRDGRIRFVGLQRPVRGLHGSLRLVDGGVWSTALAGSLAGIPLRARGGAFNPAHPALRLGIAADGRLERLRSAFAFAANQPLGGSVHLETLLEAPVTDVLVRTAFHVRRAAYGRLVIRNVSGRVDYHSSSVVLDGLRGTFGHSSLRLGGRFLLGRELDSALVLAAGGPGNALPYAQNLVPEAGVKAVAVITGGVGYRASGALWANGRGVAGSGTFAVDARGQGEFGPFAFSRADGSTLDGALRLDRPKSLSAAWLEARHYRIAVIPVPAQLPGLSLPAFPPLGGRIDGTLVGAGTPQAFALAGRMHGDALEAGSIGLGTASAGVGGKLDGLRLSGVRIEGPLGHFSGSAAVGGGAFALRGDYRGSLDALVPLTGPQEAHGAVRGNVLAVIGGANAVVQAADARLSGATIRGIRLDAVGGTIAVRSGIFHLIAANGRIEDRHVVGRESGGTIALSAPAIPVSAFRSTGLPLDRGSISAYGIADLRTHVPRFQGTLSVAGGRTSGYPVGGDARIDLNGAQARILSATGALASTYGEFSGALSGFGAPALHYDLLADVPIGDVGALARGLRIPIRELGGSFTARLRVRGSGADAVAQGLVRVPEGRYHGLAFREATAHVRLDRDGFAVDDGSLAVGSTHALLSGALNRGGEVALAVTSRAADLADFNDYFDTSEVLGGHGSLDLGLRTGPRLQSHAEVDLHALRYRSFALGDAQGGWKMHGRAVAFDTRLAGATGMLRLRGEAEPAPGGPISALRGARYRGNAQLSGLDLATWLPALGIAAPVLGRLDAQMGLSGRLAAPALTLAASVRSGSVAGYPIRDAGLRATINGSRIRILTTHADAGFVQIDGSGLLGVHAADLLDFNLHAHTADLDTAVTALVPASRGLDLAGALDADVRVGGTYGRPVVTGGFDLTAARYRGFTVPRAIGSLARAGNAIELRDVDVEFERGQAFVAGSLPLVVAPFAIGPAHAPVSIDVTARGVDLAQFAPLFPASATLGGTVDGRFGIEGTVDRPRLLGALAIAGGSYRSAFERAPIQHVDARLAFAGTSVALQTFHADVGHGTLDGTGRIELPFGAQPRWAYRLDATARAAQLDFPTYGRGTVDGTLRLTSGALRPLLAGTLSIRDAVVPVGAVYGGGAAGAPAGHSAPLLDPAFLIHAAATDNVRLRSSIVDIGLAGAVDLTGTFDAPRLAGGFTATDGTISSYNHVFRVVDAAVAFNPADGIVPTVDARAIARVTDPDPDPSRNIAGSANITVSVNGPADGTNLAVTYSSDPAYSQEQIVGLLLDVPALLGAVNFDLNRGTGGTLLRGAPGETNALLPPGVTPEQVSPVSLNQEVFSLLNGQLTQRALTPVERVFDRVFGLSDIEFTVDYGGGIGYSLRRQIGKRDFYAFLSQTVSYPERYNVGFALVPRPFDSLNFSYYEQSGITSLITSQTPGTSLLGSTRGVTGVQPLGNRAGFSLTFGRRFW